MKRIHPMTVLCEDLKFTTVDLDPWEDDGEKQVSLAEVTDDDSPLSRALVRVCGRAFHQLRLPNQIKIINALMEYGANPILKQMTESAARDGEGFGGSIRRAEQEALNRVGFRLICEEVSEPL